MQPHAHTSNDGSNGDISIETVETEAGLGRWSWRSNDNWKNTHHRSVTFHGSRIAGRNGVLKVYTITFLVSM